MNVKASDLITQKEAAEIRGVSRQSIADLVRRGKLTTVTIGKRNFLIRSEVKKFKPSTGGRPKGKQTRKRSPRA